MLTRPSFAAHVLFLFTGGAAWLLVTSPSVGLSAAAGFTIAFAAFMALVAMNALANAVAVLVRNKEEDMSLADRFNFIAVLTVIFGGAACSFGWAAGSAFGMPLVDSYYVAMTAFVALMSVTCAIYEAVSPDEKVVGDKPREKSEVAAG